METSKTGVAASYFANKKKALAKKNEEEIKLIQENFKKQQATVRGNNMVQLKSIKAQNDKAQMDEALQIEERLKKIQEDYQNTVSKIEESKKQLQDTSQKEIKFKQIRNQTKLDQEIFRNEDAVQEMSARAQRSLDKLRFRETQDRLQMVNDFAENRSELQSIQNKSINKQNIDFRRNTLANNNRFNRALQQQEIEFNDNFQRKESEFKRDLKQQTDEKKATLESQLKFYDNAMIEAKNTFKTNYNALKLKQQQIYDNLEVKGNQRIEEIRENTTEKIKLLESKKEDKFYHSVDLKPKINDKEDHYLISFKIPEYEQGLINLSANDRKVRVTFSRSYTDEGRDLAGMYGKTQKSESILNEFTLPEIMEPKKIEKIYAENIVTFKVPKK